MKGLIAFLGARSLPARFAGGQLQECGFLGGGAAGIEVFHEPPSRLVDLALAVPHGGIDAFLLEQRLVAAALGDVAGLQHDDLVGIDDGGEPVGDHQRGAVARHQRQGILNVLLGLGIERRGGLVEDQDRRSLQDGAGYGDALLFAA